MEWIILGIIALLFLSRGGFSIGATTTVVPNATGGSLSSALGNQGSAPGYYASGNPGYDAYQFPGIPITKGSSGIAQPVSGRVVTGIFTSSAPVNPPPAHSGPVGLAPILPIRVQTAPPEVASPPWASIRARII
jgi:hypothetical protein